MLDTPVLFDDLYLGQQLVTTQTYEMTAAEIIEFASRFDPQPFHLDERAAASTDFGGLVASGLHTFAASCRLGFSERPLTATIAGLGIDELRMLHPVRPGDRLSQTSEVIELRVSRTQPDRGVVCVAREVVNQHQVPVLRCTVAWLVKRLATA